MMLTLNILFWAGIAVGVVALGLYFYAFARDKEALRYGSAICLYSTVFYSGTVSIARTIGGTFGVVCASLALVMFSLIMVRVFRDVSLVEKAENDRIE